MSRESSIIDLLDTIVYSRPLPNREFDQIYMKASDMFEQAKFIKKFIKDKNIVFLGDGDGMAILLGALNNEIVEDRINSIALYDFDERILLNTKRQVEKLNIQVPMYYSLYNIIMPVKKTEVHKYDFFYINPPYGSRNEGLSCKLWIDRCMDLCVERCSGCIIIPYDHKLSWSIYNMQVIQTYLAKKGFVIRDMISYMHQYHLDDNPELKSATLIVEKVSDSISEYSDQFLGKQLVKNLYGSPRKIPKYITLSNENPLGYKDYHWEYGNDGFWDA